MSDAGTYRMFNLTRPLRLTWPLLYRQFGVNPAKATDKFTVRDFRADCLRELKKSKTRGRICTITRLQGRSCFRPRRRASRRRNCAALRLKLPTFNSATTLVRKIEIVDEDVDFRRARLVTRNGESCDEVVLVNLMQGLRQASLKTRQSLLNGGQHFGETSVQREHYTHAIAVAPRKSSHKLSNNLVKRAKGLCCNFGRRRLVT